MTNLYPGAATKHSLKSFFFGICWMLTAKTVFCLVLDVFGDPLLVNLPEFAPIWLYPE